MDNVSTQNIKSNFNSILELNIDYGMFIGSALLATSYLTTWINAPMSTAGIVFSALLNASSICGAKKIAKTDESNSLFNKTLVTLGALALSTITIPYIAVPLANRIGIITGKAAFHLGVLNLSTKAGTFVLYLLGSHFLSSAKVTLSSAEVEHMTQPELKKHYDHYYQLEGKQDWNNLEKDTQLAFLARFEKENLLYSGQFTMEWHKLTDEDIRKYNTTIWNVLLSFGDPKPIASISLLQIRCFMLNLAPPKNISLQFYFHFNLNLCKKPIRIQAYTKNKALWIFYYILANQPTLGNKTLEAYIDLFGKHKLFLPEPTIAELKNFHLAQLKLYHAFYSNDTNKFYELSLELQYEFASIFDSTPEIKDSFYLVCSIEEMKGSSAEIFDQLYKESQDLTRQLRPEYLTAIKEEYKRRFPS